MKLTTFAKVILVFALVILTFRLIIIINNIMTAQYIFDPIYILLDSICLIYIGAYYWLTISKKYKKIAERYLTVINSNLDIKQLLDDAKCSDYIRRKNNYESFGYIGIEEFGFPFELLTNAKADLLIEKINSLAPIKNNYDILALTIFQYYQEKLKQYRK
jgi:hypothetical protein